MITRRDFLIGSTAFASAYAAATMMPLRAQGTPNFGMPTPPGVGFRRMKLGDFELVALNDGIMRRPLGEEFVRNAPFAQVQETLRVQGLPTEYIDVPYTPFLVVAGNRRILMDTGFSDNGPAMTGRLLANMAAAGFKPEDIDTVLISHYHGDHISGLRNKAGQLTFPRARILVPSVEHAFWMDDERMAAAPAGMKAGFATARRVFTGLTADQLSTFTPGGEVAPGITSIPAYGHTPGHTLYSVRSGSQRFLFVADLTNVPQLFARNPDWAVVFDMNADQARDTRRKVFDMIVKENMLAGGYHFPFPAFGTISTLGNGYEFKPVA
ncbi:MAG: MBL fold metallo-hydrolase [Burkholderiales bacterium]|jgi:glyoxylase-like metal-dependent hydrolase (beta-lactamase superfamily II)|nr:MBL fold metallo-hydrolase [Burkholderiales bacterium]